MSADFSSSDLTEKQQRILQAQMGRGNKDSAAKYVLNQQGKTETFAKDSIDQMAVIYFKGCRDCEYTVESRSTKVFIENCHNCTFSFNEKIISQVMEVWKCTDVKISISVAVKTLQADLSTGLTISYDTTENFDQLVWAGCDKLSLSFAKEDKKLATGLTEMSTEFDDLLPEVDQFKLSILNGKLVSDRIVRLKGGYPTTNREADAFDAMVEKNDKAYMEYVRQMVKENPALLKTVKKGGGKARDIKEKHKPNEPCPCSSGKKYKQCCGDPKLQNSKKSTVVHEDDNDDDEKPAAD
jgi:Adenylate cyclase associated (CAP) C terminal/SEC-C motif